MSTATSNPAALTPPEPVRSPAPATPLDPDAALDPRIRRTREQLQQALATLLETKGFDSLSIQDITTAAGVNRATFYAHYADKFALLECMVATRFRSQLEARGVVFSAGCHETLRGLVLGVCDFLEHSVCPKALAEGHSRPLQPHMELAIVAVLRRIVLHGMQQHAGLTAADQLDADPCHQRRLRASALAWAIFGAAHEWVTTPNRVPSDRVATDTVALLAPLLAAAPEGHEAAAS